MSNKIADRIVDRIAASGNLHERIAEALGWTVKDTQSMSLQSLRDLVRPVDHHLADEISKAIQSGSYITAGTDLRCPNCGDNLGKDRENPNPAWCGTCGTSFANPRGYKDDDDKTATRKTAKTRMEQFQKIVDEKQFGKVDGVRVDLYSASAVVKVHDALNPEIKKKFEALPVAKMVSFAFKALGMGSKIASDADKFWKSADKYIKQYDVRKGYSGRGMFGEKSPAALTTDVSPNSDEGKKFVGATGAHTDSMGLGYIYYLRW